MDRRYKKTPFHEFTRPSISFYSAFFSSTRPRFNQTLQNFPKGLFCSKCTNFIPFLVSKPKNWPKNLLKKLLQAALLPKISSASPQIWRRFVLQGPIFGPHVPHAPTKMKVEYPLRALHAPCAFDAARIG